MDQRRPDFACFQYREYSTAAGRRAIPGQMAFRRRSCAVPQINPAQNVRITMISFVPYAAALGCEPFCGCI
jgi:hypothetical protein